MNNQDIQSIVQSVMAQLQQNPALPKPLLQPFMETAEKFPILLQRRQPSEYQTLRIGQLTKI